MINDPANDDDQTLHPPVVKITKGKSVDIFESKPVKPSTSQISRKSSAIAKKAEITPIDAPLSQILPFSYSQATLVDDYVLYISGQIGVDANFGMLVGGGPCTETSFVMTNILSVLNTLKASLKQIAKMTVYVTRLTDLYDVMNVIHSYFNEPMPAISILEVTKLPLGACVQIDAVAYVIPIKQNAASSSSSSY